MENLLIEWGGKSASLFGPTHLWNLLKITALLFYLAPESKQSFFPFIKKTVYGYLIDEKKMLWMTVIAK